MNDYRSPVPRMGRLSSLLFAFDVPGFLQLGRRLGRENGRAHFEGPAIGPWQFWLGGQVVTVLSSETDARTLLSSPAVRFYKPEVLAPLLGAQSPLLSSGPARVPALSRGQLGGYRSIGGHEPLNVDVREIVHRHVHIAWSGADDVRFGRRTRPSQPFDLAPILRAAALEIGITMLDKANRRVAGQPGQRAHRYFNGRAVDRIALTMFDAADTPALVVPSLRRLSRRWHRLAPARVDLLDVLGLGSAPAVDQDAAVTLLAGLVDNPVMIALHAVGLYRMRGGGPEAPVDTITDRALQMAPVPLILRECIAPLDVGGLHFEPGEAVAVDARMADLSFGHGQHHCPGVALARTFVRAVLDTLVALRLFPVAGGRWRRVRLSYGPDSLIVQHHTDTDL